MTTRALTSRGWRSGQSGWDVLQQLGSTIEGAAADHVESNIRRFAGITLARGFCCRLE